MVGRAVDGKGERRGEERREGEKEGPAFQSPVSTRDPRPLNHPPQLGRNSVLFSPLFSPPPFFFPSFYLLSFSIFSVFFFSPFISPPFFDLSYQTTETTARPFFFSFFSSFFFFFVVVVVVVVVFFYYYYYYASNIITTTTTLVRVSCLARFDEGIRLWENGRLVRGWWRVTRPVDKVRNLGLGRKRNATYGRR